MNSSNILKEIENLINDYEDYITYKAKGYTLKNEMNAILYIAKEISDEKDLKIKELESQLEKEKQNIKTIIKYRKR